MLQGSAPRLGFRIRFLLFAGPCKISHGMFCFSQGAVFDTRNRYVL